MLDRRRFRTGESNEDHNAAPGHCRFESLVGGGDLIQRQPLRDLETLMEWLNGGVRGIGRYGSMNRQQFEIDADVRPEGDLDDVVNALCCNRSNMLD